MPTNLPQRDTQKSYDWFLVLVVAFMLASAALEFIDPAPMDVEAALDQTAAP